LSIRRKLIYSRHKRDPNLGKKEKPAKKGAKGGGGVQIKLMPALNRVLRFHGQKRGTKTVIGRAKLGEKAMRGKGKSGLLWVAENRVIGKKRCRGRLKLGRDRRTT